VTKKEVENFVSYVVVYMMVTGGLHGR